MVVSMTVESHLALLFFLVVLEKKAVSLFVSTTTYYWACHGFVCFENAPACLDRAQVS